MIRVPRVYWVRGASRILNLAHVYTIALGAILSTILGLLAGRVQPVSNKGSPLTKEAPVSPSAFWTVHKSRASSTIAMSFTRPELGSLSVTFMGELAVQASA